MRDVIAQAKTAEAYREASKRLASEPEDCRAAIIAEALAVDDRLAGVYDIPRRFKDAKLADLDPRVVSVFQQTLDTLPNVAEILAKNVEHHSRWGIQIPEWSANHARRFVAGHKGVACLGPAGVGKTHAMAAYLREASDRFYEGRFVGATDLAAALRSSFEDRSESAATIVEKLVNVSLLGIDDIDKIKLTPFVAENLFAIVNGRYERELPICVTSNLSPSDLVKAFSANEHGKAIIDRLREMIAVWVPFKGASRRTATILPKETA